MRRLVLAVLIVALGCGCVFDAKKRRAYVAAGSLTFGGAYAASMVTGAYYYRDEGSPAYFVPIIGPIWAAADYRKSDHPVAGYGDYGDVRSTRDGAGAALMGLWAVPLVSAQAFGLAMVLLAALSPASDGQTDVQAPVDQGPSGSLSIAPLPGGGSVAVLSGSF